MKAIYERELRAYFITPAGYVFLAIFMLLSGVLFWFNNINFGVTSVKNLLSLLTTWSAFILPVLTMRLFSEDRRLKTDQLLLTAPVKTGAIVLGKFLAAGTVVLAAVLALFIYTVTLAFFGEMNWAETVSCFIGFTLLCGAILSIGAFMSALSESQTVAAVATYAVLIPTVFLGNIADAAPGVLKSVCLWLSPTNRFLDFAMGILDPSAIVYYVSLIVLFLYLTAAATDKRRN